MYEHEHKHEPFMSFCQLNGIFFLLKVRRVLISDQTFRLIQKVKFTIEIYCSMDMNITISQYCSFINVPHTYIGWCPYGVFFFGIDTLSLSFLFILFRCSESKYICYCLCYSDRVVLLMFYYFDFRSKLINTDLRALNDST